MVSIDDDMHTLTLSLSLFRHQPLKVRTLPMLLLQKVYHRHKVVDFSQPIDQLSASCSERGNLIVRRGDYSHHEERVNILDLEFEDELLAPRIHVECCNIAIEALW